MPTSWLSLVAAALMIFAAKGKKDPDKEEDKGGPPGSACQVDTDCKSPGVCYEAKCIMSAKDIAPAPEPEPAPAPEPEPEPPAVEGGAQ